MNHINLITVIDHLHISQPAIKAIQNTILI